MTVVLNTSDGCILDHNKALTSAYSQCIVSASLPLSQLCNDEEKEGTRDVLHQCSADVFNSYMLCPESLTAQFRVNPETSCAVKYTSLEPQHKSNETIVTDKLTNQENISVAVCSLSDDSCDDTARHVTNDKCVGDLMSDNITVISRKKREDLSPDYSVNTTNSRYQALIPDLEKQKNSAVISDSLTNVENVVTDCETSWHEQKCEITTVYDSSSDDQKSKITCDASKPSNTEPDQPNSAPSKTCELKRLSLRLKNGFFTVKVPFMMDSQFKKIRSHFSPEGVTNGEQRKQIDVSDIQEVLHSKQKKRKSEKKTRSSEEEKLLAVHSSLVDLGRERGIFLKHILLPLDNNLLSRQRGQLDHLGDVFTPLLMSADGSPLLHMGDCLQPLMINSYDSVSFCATELIHRQIFHKNAEACFVDIGGTGYILPPRSQFLISNLEDFCDHLYLELEEESYDLIVLDPPWENKSVKRKKSYPMMDEDSLQQLPMVRLARPGCLLALWVTNNERLEDYSLNILFPLWGFTAVARWHWLKVTQTGDLISSMEGHKKPYEVLLLGRASWSRSSDVMEEKRMEPPQSGVIVNVPCSLHSKKPPLAEVLQPYLPDNPRCLELFARNLWPGWTSWGREVLKHQNLIFFDITDHPC